MASHSSLVAQMNALNSMSTEDRLMQARQQRQEQLCRWEDAEAEYSPKESEKMPNGGLSKERAVKFGACVTLLEAAARDDLKEVKSLLEDQQTCPNQANDDGLTALHQACIDNFEDMARLLIKHGANVNAVDSENWTPLHAACTCGHTNVAKILIESGSDLLALNADNNMPYDICEDDETLDFVEKAMAGKGITQHQINHIRSSKERQIIADMQALVDEGKDLSFKDEVGATVLHFAAANGYAELTKYLALHSCGVNIRDKDGWTSLHAAACWNQLEIVEFLGQQGADPSIKNDLGELPSDVTDDDEIKNLLQKIRAAMKDKKSRKLFAGFKGFSSRNNSRRASGMRGQSFRGRSKRDKKSGISTIEAKSEAQFWSGNQDTADILKNPTKHNDHSAAFSEGNSDQNCHSSQDRNGLGNSPETGEIDGHFATEINSKSDTILKKAKIQHTPNKELSEVARSREISDENLSETSKPNGTHSSNGSIRNIMSSRNQYSIGTSFSSARKETGTSLSSGKTLAELKRERAQEKSNKALPLTPDNDRSTVTPSPNYSDDIKQFKGLTANDLSAKRRKKKSCVVM